MTENYGKITAYLAEGHESEALAYGRRTIRSCSDPIEWVQTAIRLRDTGNQSISRSLLQIIIEERPRFTPAYYELAFLHRLEGEHRRAVALLSLSLEHDPFPFRTRLFLAHMLYASGAPREAEYILTQAHAKYCDERSELDTMYAFGNYLEGNPLGRSVILLDRLVSNNTLLNNQQLYDKIALAIANQKPFAFVRLGDGEGGVLRLNGVDEAAYRPLYDQNRQELISMWFGPSFAWRTNGFLDLVSNLVTLLDECDVVGIPYETWIQHEYKISSLRGIPSLVNVIHSFTDKQSSSRNFSSQIAHVELQKTGKLAEIIRLARKISIISCLESLPNALKSKFDLEEVTFYRIPGERGSRHVLGETTVEGTHFPDRFEQLQAELSRPHSGRVFLIAGGILGKLYAMTIRRHGGIAIDIGSVVDTWAGYATRPGHTASEALV